MVEIENFRYQNTLPQKIVQKVQNIFHAQSSIEGQTVEPIITHKDKDSEFSSYITKGYEALCPFIISFFNDRDINNPIQYFDEFNVGIAMYSGIIAMYFGDNIIKEDPNSPPMDIDLMAGFWSGFSSIPYASGFDQIVMQKDPHSTKKYVIERTNKFLLFYDWKENNAFNFTFEKISSLFHELIEYIEISTILSDSVTKMVKEKQKATHLHINDFILKKFWKKGYF